MNQAQSATFRYWQKKYPALVAQAVQAAGVAGQPGFGQTDTFDSIMGSLNSLLTSYGQYKIASDVATSQTSANKNILSLPGTGSTATNWLLIGGVGLLAVVGIVLFARKRRS